MMNLFLATLFILLQGVPGKPSQEARPKKVDDPDLLDPGLKTYELPDVKKVSLEGKDLPTSEIFRALGEQTGLNLSWKYVDDQKTLSVSWKDLTPLEAFDELCRRHGDLHYNIQMEKVWDKKSGSTISKGVRVLFMRGKFPAAPASYLRHYRVTLYRLTLTRQTDYLKQKNEGRIQVKVLWTPDVSPRLLRFFRVDLLEDDQGQSLINRETNRYEHRRSIQASKGVQEQYLLVSFPFSYPERGVKSLSHLKGRFLFRYPQKSREIVFDDLRDSPPVKEFRGLALSVEDVRVSQRSVHVKVKVEGEWDTPEDSYLESKKSWKDVYPFDAQDVTLLSEEGEVLPLVRSSFQSATKSKVFSLEFDNREGKGVGGLKILCAESYSYDKVAFEWKDVVLPSAE